MGVKQISDDEVTGIGSDPNLLEAFYREHAPTVRVFLARRVGNPQDVADLTAEVFLAAIDHAHRYRAKDGRPVGWLLGIARNKVADAQRGQARRLRAESRLMGRRMLDEDAIARIEDRIAAESSARLLYEALATLPARDRQLMELVAVDGLSVADAAQELGVKPGTARVRLHRSRARLRDHLGDHSLLETSDEDLPALVVREASA